MRTTRLAVLLALAGAALATGGRAFAGPVPHADAYSSGGLTAAIGTGGLRRTIRIPDSGVVRHVRVSVRLHARDLRAIGLTLVAPDGTAHRLLAPAAATGTDLGSGAGCGGRLATFDVAVGGHLDSAGAWTLAVSDDGSATGTMLCWGVTVTHLEEVARNGGLTALLGYRRAAGPSDGLPVDNVRLRILVGGRTVYAERIGGRLVPQYAGTGSDSVRLVDLDRDARPEVLLRLSSGGAHCCYTLRAYRVSGGSVRRSSHDFENTPPTLERIGGRAVLVAADNRFAYLFTSFAASGLPVQAVRWSSGQFVDATRSYPALVERDARLWRRTTTQVLRMTDGDVRGVLAAWAADECLLGHAPQARARVARLLRAGKLSTRHDEWPSGSHYVAALWRALQSYGYLR
jgi:proprotein convertase P-domain-containing protein